MAAWLHVLGSSEQMQQQTPDWLLDVAYQLQNVRRQLEQENRTTGWDPGAARSLLADTLNGQPEDWENTLSYEQARWEHLQNLFREVDAELISRRLQPAEQVRAAEVAQPRPRGTVIVACVPELSPQNQFYLRRLAETGAARVRIWVNAPRTECGRFDAFGQPLAVITQGIWAGQGWCECAVSVPRRLRAEEVVTRPAEQEVIHSVAGKAEFGRMARQLAGGYDARQVLIASCDKSFSSTLVTAFRPEWELILPEGRSLLASEVGQIPQLLYAACTAAEEPGSGIRVNAFSDLLRNCPLQKALWQEQSEKLLGVNAWLDELVSTYLPSGAQHLLAVAQREAEKAKAHRNAKEYVAWIKQVYRFVNDCCAPDSCPEQLRTLAYSLHRFYQTAEPKMQQAVRSMAELMLKAADLVEKMLCTPPVALALLASCVERMAPGKLEGAGRRDTAINIRGWRELSYAPEPRLILTGMHEGCVPERAPADSWLPDAYRVFLNMTNGESRRARDTFLFHALLQSRPADAVHIVLARSTADGKPIAPSSLLLRCDSLRETAERVSRLYADPPPPDAEEEYTPVPFKTLPENTELQPGRMEKLQRGRMESIRLLAPHVPNPFASPEKTYSPSLINSFLACPLRFWLNKLLHINPIDALQADKGEPDAAEYGELLHKVLQQVTTAFPKAKDGENKASLQEKVEAYALDCAQQVVLEQYGDESQTLTAPLKFMLRNIQHSVRAWAACHAADLCDGWEVWHCEHELKFSLPEQDDCAEIPFAMRVDRVDRKSFSGKYKYRVIDYKTNDKTPKEAHFANLQARAEELYRTWMRPELLIEGEKKTARWTSVQLPLYAEGIRRHFGLSELPETGFYNLPRTKPQNVTYKALEYQHEAAMACVRRVVQLLRAGECLFSAESLGCPLTYNQFGALGTDNNPDPRAMCSLPPLPPIES